MFYTNIALIYALARPAYPQELFNLILQQVPSDQKQLYVDIGCGNGQLLIPLSAHFKESIGVDPDTDMLQVAQENIENAHTQHIKLIQSTAETFFETADEKCISLVTAGRSFHWMNQAYIIPLIRKKLCDDGVFIILGEADGGIWKRDVPWLACVRNIIFEEFPDKEPFIPIKGHTYSIEITQHHLKKQFSSVEQFHINAQQTWTIDKVINLFFSTSGLLDWLGDDKETFATRAHQVLLKLYPSGKFQDISRFGITCCKK